MQMYIKFAKLQTFNEKIMEESTEFIEETQVKETQEETQVKELRRRVYELESANKELAEKVEHLKEEKNKIYGWWKEGEIGRASCREKAGEGRCATAGKARNRSNGQE